MDMHQETNRINDKSSSLPTVDLTGDTSPTHILDVNDDCLIEIFSSNVLTPMDLCRLAQTCTRFKQIAHRAVPGYFGITIIGTLYGYSWRNVCHRRVSKRNVKSILSHFGYRLSYLHLEVTGVDVTLITKYCSDAKLKRLRIHNVETVKGSDCQQFKSIIDGLLALDLLYCCLKDVTFLNFNFNSLNALTIDGATDFDAILHKTFPNLNAFRFENGANSQSDNTVAISKFIGRHMSLRFLNLTGPSICCNTEFVDAINGCKELSALHLRNLNTSGYSIDLLNALTLPKLRSISGVSLTNSVDCSDTIPLWETATLLETVRLYCKKYVPHRVFHTLSQLQYLRNVTLDLDSFDRIPSVMFIQVRSFHLIARTGKFCAVDIFNIIAQMPNLQQFIFWDNDQFALNEEDFTDIVKIVEKRSHQLELQCRCNFDVPHKDGAQQNVKLIKLN